MIQALGRPDNAREQWGHTPEEGRQLDEAWKKASKEADIKGLKDVEKSRFLQEAVNKTGILIATTQRAPNGMGLDYISRGFELNVSNDKGLVGIACRGDAPSMRPFTGKTSAGIGIGATLHDIESAYGAPSNKSEQDRDGAHRTMLFYKSHKMILQLEDGRLSRFSLGKP